MSDIIYDIEVLEEVYDVKVEEEIHNVLINSVLEINKQLFYVNEKPNGSINGVNKLFTTTYDYYPATTIVYRNGILQRLNIDYFERGNKVIEFDEAPSNLTYEDDINIIYIKIEV